MIPEDKSFPIMSVPTTILARQLSTASCFFFLIIKKKTHLFIYLFMAALGLCCCMQSFSSCGDRGLPFIAVHGLLIMVASLVAELGL